LLPLLASGLVSRIPVAYSICAVLFTEGQAVPVHGALLGPASPSLAFVALDAGDYRHPVGLVLVAVVACKADAVANAVPARESVIARFLC